MRLWSLHPRYLDALGLVALWREALPAKAVLRGETRGYRHHPQLERFRSHAFPRSAINAYLGEIHAEAGRRGYAYERRHLVRKLARRCRTLHRHWLGTTHVKCHPFFRRIQGKIEPWERS